MTPDETPTATESLALGTYRPDNVARHRRTNHDGGFGLDDSRLFTCDVLDCRTQDISVIETDRHEHRKVGLYNVGRIQATAATRANKIQESNRKSKGQTICQKISYTRKSSTEAIPNADLDDGVVDIAMRKVAKCHQSRELKESGVNVVLMQLRVDGIAK